MSSDAPRLPDYDLDETVDVAEPAQLAALAHPLRSALLDLVSERAATIGELATAVGRPHGTVSYHVTLLLEAGLLKVVRTRRVRAVEERYFGRTARTVNIRVVRRAGDDSPVCVNELTEAATESVPAHEADTLWTTRRHARIPRERAAEFWRRVEVLVREFSDLPREGDTVHAFAVGLYPTDHPALPPAEQEG